MPVNQELDIDQILELTPGIAKKYANVNRATVLRDLKELQELDLLVKVGRKYKADTMILRTLMPGKKS